MNSLNSTIAIAGRTLLALMFIGNGIGLVKGFAVVSAQMSEKRVPMAALALIASIALLFGGGVALLVGWHVQWLAWIFFVWLIPAILMFHAPWAFPPEQFQEQLIHFLKNLAILGALLLLVAGSVDGMKN